jgi:hypothetical protein
MADVERREAGVVHGRHVFACADRDSLWVEIAGPKGGNAWQMTPHLARELAALLHVAAEEAERYA